MEAKIKKIEAVWIRFDFYYTIDNTKFKERGKVLVNSDTLTIIDTNTDTNKITTVEINAANKILRKLKHRYDIKYYGKKQKRGVYLIDSNDLQQGFTDNIVTVKCYVNQGEC